MKLYLFGGAETNQGQAPILKRLINDVISEIKPKQLLHIPYARTNVPEGEEDVWGEGWVSRDLNLNGIELLDARKKEDLARSRKPAIFVNGGHDQGRLFKEITTNKRLHELVMNTDYYIGESAGSMVTAEYQRTHGGSNRIGEGLGILKDTIIEPHYTERDRHELLRKEIKETGAKYGIGVDSLTAIVIKLSNYPEKYEVLGNGLVEFIKAKELE